MQQLTEIIFFSGIIAIVAIFNMDEDPIKKIYKVPMCRVTCDIFNGEVNCHGVTEDVWSDFLDRELAKSKHNYRGVCRKNLTMTAPSATLESLGVNFAT